MSLHKKAPSTTKFKIEQKVPDCSKKRGPYVVERDLNPNDVVIKRRFGEGAKPLFERDDISINQKASILDDSEANKSTRDEVQWSPGNNTEKASSAVRNNANSSNIINTKATTQAHKKEMCNYSNVHQEKYRLKRSFSSSSEESVSPQRCRWNVIHQPNSDRNSHVSSEVQKYKDVEVSALPNSSREKNRNSLVNTTSLSGCRRINIPYFSNPQREKERLRRRYGTSTPKKTRHDSKSRSPPLTYRMTPNKKYETSSRGSRRRRSSSDDSRYYSSRSPRHHHTSESKSIRKHSPHNVERNPNRDQNTAQLTTPLATTQIITIPVPMPEYPYVFPTWTHQPAWGAPIPHGAPQRFTPYTLSPAVLPTIRTSYGMPRPHNFRMFRPQQRYHPVNFAPRLPRGNRHND